ncbi:MAG TPA: glycoside hydrolase family 13 protein [Thermoflexales bacterium]|nr:glycoside hydrolase family 13 protein [Thermoflexales bacterium]HQZ23462.1 glycoside hydrolase family 13 protein [Thermoflexales bacterium]HQZ99353.1 glycoside hydrolase family 13 protein [Thermoflexales bacterium]
MIHTPDWVQDAVFYQIFPDRFARSLKAAPLINLEAWDARPTNHGFKGGDLWGVIEHLDYLQDLGVTAIYFTPIFQSAANHRYHTHDYYQVDPILGGDAAFSALLKACHKRKMRVVIDGVFNHASRGFYQFNHILENDSHSPYVDWFHIKGYPLHAYSGKPNYEAWWNIPALPKFNTANPAVREFIFEVAEYWIEQGVDGWRLDVPGEIDDDSFWQEFRRRVKAINKDAYIVGEIWHEAQRWLKGDQFDGVMNYQFTKAAIGFFAGKHMDGGLANDMGYSPVSPMDGGDFGRAILRNLSLYDSPINQAQLNLLDSHDTARFLTIARGDVNALKLATLLQMTYPGAPSIYYGDEIGMTGGKDPDCRRGFSWNESTWDKNLRQYFKDAIALRKTHPALRRGAIGFLLAEGDQVAFVRKLDEAILIVAFNAGASDMEVDISAPASLGITEDMTALGIFNSLGAYPVTNGQLTGVKVPARSGIVLEMTRGK